MNAIQKTIEVINELYEKTGKKPIQAEVRRAMGGGRLAPSVRPLDSGRKPKIRQLRPNPSLSCLKS